MDPDFYYYFKRYKVGVFINLIKDGDFKIFVFHNNNEIRIPKMEGESLPQSTQPIPKESLDAYVQEIKSRRIHLDHQWMGTIKFFKENPVITESDIEYIKTHALSLINISQATGVLWSDELIARYVSDWSWDLLSANASIVWDSSRIDKFEGYINFKLLSSNTGLNITLKTLDKYSDRWDWGVLSANPSLGRLKGFLIHPLVKWENAIHGERNYFEFEDLRRSWLRESLQHNSGIKWDLKLFQKYRDRIDFWLLARFGQLDDEVIYQFGEELNVNHNIGTRSTKYSDWRDQHPVLRNGWENLMMNDNFKVNEKMFEFLGKQNVTVIDYDGNAMNGHTRVEVKSKVKEIIPPERINLSFEQLFYHGVSLSDSVISETFVHPIIYNNIIKPAFQKDSSLVTSLFESFGAP